jgi:hypothetical protein
MPTDHSYILSFDNFLEMFEGPDSVLNNVPTAITETLIVYQPLDNYEKFRCKNCFFSGDRIIMGESHIFRFNNPQQGAVTLNSKLFAFFLTPPPPCVFGLACGAII